jgi:hypothetical protein
VQTAEARRRRCTLHRRSVPRAFAQQSRRSARQIGTERPPLYRRLQHRRQSSSQIKPSRVENYSDQPRKYHTLFLDAANSIRSVEVPGRNPENKPPAPPASARYGVDRKRRARLKLAIKDQLLLDNKASTVVNLPQPAKVLLATHSKSPSTGKRQNGRRRRKPPATGKKSSDASAGGTDLIIYDQCTPKQMPNCNTLFIGRLPPATLEGCGPKAPTIIRDINQRIPSRNPGDGQRKSTKAPPSNRRRVRNSWVPTLAKGTTPRSTRFTPSGPRAG